MLSVWVTWRMVMRDAKCNDFRSAADGYVVYMPMYISNVLLRQIF